MTMRRSFEVRYYECDMQKVVHNAIYLAWCDDASDKWFRQVGVDFSDAGWDVMVKAATVTWSSPARMGDVVDVDLGVSRWGNTSFDIAFHGTCGDRNVFEATITYVAVRADTLAEAVPVPDDFRRAATEQ